MIILERGGNSLPAVFHTEAAATNFIRSHVKAATVVNADEASSWDSLNTKFEMQCINQVRNNP